MMSMDHGDPAFTFSRQEGVEMDSIDQVIISLWFFPVTFTIIIPLFIGIVWTVLSVVSSLFKFVFLKERYFDLRRSDSVAGNSA